MRNKDSLDRNFYMASRQTTIQEKKAQPVLENGPIALLRKRSD